MKSKKKIISLVLSLSMVVGMLSPMFSTTSLASAIYTLQGLEIETSFDPNFNSEGERKAIDFVNPDFLNSSPAFPGQGLSLFTPGNRAVVSEGSIKSNTAIVVDANMTVKQVINKAPSVGAKPSFTESTDVVAPEGGFVLLACDSSYASAGYKKFIAEKFNVGDVVKLKLNGSDITISQVLALTKGNEAKQARLSLNYTDMYTTTSTTTVVSGVVTERNSNSVYQINIQLLDANNKLIGPNTGTVIVPDVNVVSGSAITVPSVVTGPAITTPNVVSGSAIQGMIVNLNEDGTFMETVSLQSGVNYIDVAIIENGVLMTESKKSMIVFKKDTVIADEEKDVIMWIDQYASAKSLNTVEKIEKMVQTAKNAGVTAFAFDVKGTEGYASYKKATLTNVPYMTETKNPNKYVDMQIDFLEEMIKASHANGIKLLASYNFFTEGNLSTNDSAIDIYKNNRDWAEVLQAPEDKGALKNVLDSARTTALAFVNPANDEVQEFQLKRVEEVLMNYNVDGIIMDRFRYDNQYADFSDETRVKFEAYLQKQGKTLVNWPADAYQINADGSMTTGSLYLDWLTFRSSVIGDFAADLKELIVKYEGLQNREISLSSYVGSWYESYYQNGVNWADESFIYNERLQFPQAELYTPEYRTTSYVDSIDFLMIGCYYDTEEKIAKYTTQGNILTNGKIPLIGSIDLTNLKTPELQRVGYQAAFKNSDGAMIFDLCYVNWYMIECAIKDKVYVNPLMISAYNPATKDILSIHDVNTTRAEDTIVLYNSEFGDQTGTNQWGVEVVVGADGVVTYVANKQQAIDWVWGDKAELNNSTIPAGGFVLSSADKSGSRVLRQLLANSFSVGDKVAVAYITDYLQYDSITFNKANESLSFVVKAWGSLDGAKVLVNGLEASLQDEITGLYAIPVTLVNGNNEFLVEVYVDGLKTLTKTITMIGQGITGEPVEPTPTPVEPTPTPVTPTPTNPGNTEGSTPDNKEPELIVIEESNKNASVVAKVERDKDGNVVNAVASVTIDKASKVTTSNNKKSSSVSLELPVDEILSVARKLAEVSKDAKLVLELTLPEKELIKQLKTSKREVVEVELLLPSALLKNDNIELSSIMLSKDVLEGAKAGKADISIVVKDEKKVSYTLTMKYDDLKDVDKKELSNINLALEVYKTSANKELQNLLKQDTKNKSGNVISFLKEDILPTNANVNAYVGNTSKKAKTVYVYRYNKATNKLEELVEGKFIVDKSGYVSIDVDYTSEYVILDKKPSNKLVTSIKDQIKNYRISTIKTK